VKFDLPAFPEAEHGGAPRPVAADSEDAEGRKPLLKLEAYTRAWKLAAGGALGVPEKCKRGFGVKRPVQQRREPCFPLLDLGPGCVEQMVRQAVNARRNAARVAAAIG